MFALWTIQFKGFFKKNKIIIFINILNIEKCSEMIKTYSEFIKEAFGKAFGRGYGLSVTFVDKRGRKYRETREFESMDSCRQFMVDWVEKHSGSRVEYFDICSGSNYSDPDFLESWAGYGGYFANIVNGGYREQQQFSYREIQTIENCEVDINSFLGIR
jgi:hypothetical protein